MPLDMHLTKRMDRALSALDDRGTTGPRLVDDAHRLWRRVQKLLAMSLVPASADTDALELACYALQLPFAYEKSARVRITGRTNLRDRAAQAAERLPAFFDDNSDASLLDRTLRLIDELPDRAPRMADARLLADAVNLEDFGVSGMIAQTIQLVRQGDGLVQLIEGAEKRELYGYWEARLKDGFHFEPSRRLAHRRLENARAAAKLLAEEWLQEA
jgi:hypothetical protein